MSSPVAGGTTFGHEAQEDGVLFRPAPLTVVELLALRTASREVGVGQRRLTRDLKCLRAIGMVGTRCTTKEDGGSCGLQDDLFNWCRWVSQTSLPNASRQSQKGGVKIRSEERARVRATD
mmetsp:Transcript_38389/g.115015  ORF Transcript_38389/g.115015 Transcript_38389/m.115015 type:complete len:120 (-) Transcript_38389:130-489(-)